MSGEATYEALNISSRSFILGDKTMLPKIPQTITETEKQIIEKHQWGDFFQISGDGASTIAGAPVNVESNPVPVA
jgi:hypothetical protein